MAALLNGLITVWKGLMRGQSLEGNEKACQAVSGDGHSWWTAQQGQRPGGWSCLASATVLQPRQASSSPALFRGALLHFTRPPRWHRGDCDLPAPTPSVIPVLSPSTRRHSREATCCLPPAPAMHLPSQVFVREAGDMGPPPPLDGGVCGPVYLANELCKSTFIWGTAGSRRGCLGLPGAAARLRPGIKGE